MKALNISEVKEIQLQILKEFDRFCDDNGLRYCAIYGTLLGAIRHGGYIPWDDDIDLAMPREDYERFIDEFTSGSITLYSAKKQINYNYPFAKLCMNGTLQVEKDNKNSNIGIHVDIFPVDYLPEESRMICKKLKRIKCLMWIIIRKYSSQESYGLKAIAKKMLKLVFLPISSHWLALQIDKIAKHAERSSFCGNLCWGEGKKEIMPATLYEDLIDVKFEDQTIRIPRAYDNYLTKIYGDYLTPPPAEKQVCLHVSEAYLLEERENP